MVAAELAPVAIRTYDVQRGPALSVWHSHAPQDLKADQIAELDWAGHLQGEQRVFDEVRTPIVERIEPEERIDGNRCFEGGPL